MVGTPARRSVPGTLPVSSGFADRSITSSSSWNATPIFSPYTRSGSSYSDGRVGEDDAALRRGGDQGTGLVGEHLDVELDRVVVRLRTEGLVHLTEDETLEGVGLQADGPLAEPRHQLARAGEQDVAGEDGDVVAPHRVRGGHAAATVGAVHDVVVVQRAEVRDLERLGDVDHRVGVAVAELRGKQRQHRTDALASGLVEVAARGIGQRVGDAHVVGEAGLDALEAVFDRTARRGVRPGR